MDLLATYASSTFTATVGFSPAMMFSWATSSVIKLYVGTALAVLGDLKDWFIAALIIGAVIYFSAAALYFFKH